jgi:hypothetical protein
LSRFSYKYRSKNHNLWIEYEAKREIVSVIKEANEGKKEKSPIYREKDTYLLYESGANGYTLSLSPKVKFKNFDEFLGMFHYRSEVERVINLTKNILFVNVPFTSMKGIEKFKNLKSIDLRGLQFSNLSGLEQHKSVTTIKLSRLPNLVSLEGIPKSTEALSIENCQALKNISGVSGCSKLSKFISFDNNSLSDLEGLPSHKLDLISIDFNASRISNKFSLKGIKTVERLIVDVSPYGEDLSKKFDLNKDNFPASAREVLFSDSFFRKMDLVLAINELVHWGKIGKLVLSIDGDKSDRLRYDYSNNGLAPLIYQINDGEDTETFKKWLSDNADYSCVRHIEQ